jgi:hypothetical protein
MGYPTDFAAPISVPGATASLQADLLHTTTLPPQVSPSTLEHFIASPPIGYRDGVVFNNYQEVFQFMQRCPAYPLNSAHIAEFPTRAEAVFYVTAPISPENQASSMCSPEDIPDDMSCISTQARSRTVPPQDIPVSQQAYASPMQQPFPPHPPTCAAPIPPVQPLPMPAYHPPPMYQQQQQHWIPPPVMYPPGYPMGPGYPSGFFPSHGLPMLMPFSMPSPSPQVSTLKFDKFSGKLSDWP